MTGNWPRVSYPSNEKERNITWNHAWISPYESLWGIFEKFKFANRATVKDIYHLFGTEYVRNLKSSTIGRPHRDCVRLSGLDNDLVESAFSCPLLEINSQNIDQLFGIMPNHPFKRDSFIRNELFFCPECIKSGFHSLFHQFKLLHKCPYHQIPLHKGCPNCDKPHPFALTDEFTNEPFRCLCGHLFLEMKKERPYFLKWKQIPIGDIKSKNILTWLNLDENQISRLKSFYFPLNIKIEEYDTLDYILSVLQPRYSTPNIENHRVVKSSPYIRRLIGDKEKEERKLYYPLKVNKFYNAIYHSSVQTVQSIAAHLRGTLLKDHKSCINRLLKSSRTNEPICPYALAYAHWMKFILGYESIWLVRRAYPYRDDANNIEFGSKQDHLYLLNLFKTWQFELDEFTEESRTALSWILNRVLGHLIWNHFNNWLSISQDAAENRIEYKVVPFGLKDLPLYILIIPENKNKPLEFHWWNESLKNKVKLICPYSSRWRKHK
ncbi:hypothetical protein [Ammoniphilus resinae]|uniref:Uncharacterized protein n=1 Tax=Ammoniphilus resinae TaxID=861532 RepID=A0ABS4GNU8_9BACL|nr:hypothetical protein [Ammoniphilus resinae]MBP1931949.1 hypothetical protein [Ammoniphilus resinae]